MKRTDIMSYKEQAIAKINEEHMKARLTSKGQAVAGCVIAQLEHFCEQEKEFAQAVVQSTKTVQECIESTVKGVGNAISDLEVYARAAQFYFPGSKVRYILTLDLIGDAAAPDITVTEGGKDEEPKKKSLEFSFDALFGGGGDD